MKILQTLRVRKSVDRFKFTDWGTIVKRGVTSQRDHRITEWVQLNIGGKNMLFNVSPYVNIDILIKPIDTQKNYYFDFSCSTKGNIRLEDIRTWDGNTDVFIRSEQKYTGLLRSGFVIDDIDTEIKINDTLFQINTGLIEEDLQPGDKFELEKPQRVEFTIKIGWKRTEKLAPYIDEKGTRFDYDYYPRIWVKTLTYIDDINKENNPQNTGV